MSWTVLPAKNLGKPRMQYSHTQGTVRTIGNSKHLWLTELKL